MKKTIFIVVILIAGAYSSKVIYEVFKSFSDDQGVLHSIPEEYLDLFNEKYQSEFNSCFTYTSKVHPDVSNFLFKESYSVVVYKLPLLHNAPLQQIVKEKILDSKASNDVLYADISQQSYILKYKSGKLNPISHIYISVIGNNTETVTRNDSVIYYSSNFRSFSLKIDEDKDIDIFARSGTNEDFRGEPVPVNLLFLKKNNSVYFIILAVNDRNHPLANNSLYELMAL